MIYYFTPYLKNNLGQAYNHYCDMVPNDDDWITFMDGDIMQLHLDWSTKWETILELNSDAGIVTCMTNRAAKSNTDQVDHSMYNETDIRKHKTHANYLYEKYGYSTKHMSIDFMSGFFFSFKKELWKNIGGFTNGILDVDKSFYNRARKSNKSCIVAQGFYVLHYYRLNEGETYTKHLKVK